MRHAAKGRASAISTHKERTTLRTSRVGRANKALECAPAGRSHGVAVLDDGLLALFGLDIPTVTLSTRITVNGALLA